MNYCRTRLIYWLDDITGLYWTITDTVCRYWHGLYVFFMDDMETVLTEYNAKKHTWVI